MKLKKILKSSAFQSFACWLAHLYIWLVYITSSWQRVGQEYSDQLVASGKPFIIAFWHGRLLMIPPLAPKKNHNIHVLISHHNDGELIAKTMTHFDYQLIRGSSKKGGMAAFKAILKTLKSGDIVAITPDGPKGPRMRVGGHIVKFAQMSCVPVLPITFSLSNSKILRSWDRFMLAKPFGRGACVFGEPFYVGKNATDEELEKAGIELENSLNSITRKADEMVGVVPIEPDDAKT